MIQNEKLADSQNHFFSILTIALFVHQQFIWS